MSSSEQPASKRLRRTSTTEHSTTAGGGDDADDVGEEEEISVLVSSAPQNCYFDQLGKDATSRILSFLGWKDILKARVSKRVREASLVATISDVLGVCVDTPGRDLGKIGAALPGVQDVRIRGRRPEKTLDLSGLSRFHGIKQLEIPFILDGSYPGLFTLKSLETLNLLGNVNLCFDLGDITVLPNLKEIDFGNCRNLTGELESLYHLRDKLKRLDLRSCTKVTGNLMSLAEFSLLYFLELTLTNVTGDIRDIQPNHFPCLRSLRIATTRIYGSSGGLMAIDDAPGICAAWRRLIAHPRPLSRLSRYEFPLLQLDSSSPDYYSPGRYTVYARHPPFQVELLNVGSRYGYRWQNTFNVATDIIWLDPEPKPSDEHYTAYRASLDKLEEEHRGSIYRGYNRPPTQEEWKQIARV